MTGVSAAPLRGARGSGFIGGSGVGLALKCKMSSVVEIFISEALCVSSFREAGVQGKELGAETVVFDSYQVFNQSRRFAHNSDILNRG